MKKIFGMRLWKRRGRKVGGSEGIGVNFPTGELNQRDSLTIEGRKDVRS
jgi:hypothetical protein